MPESMTAAWVAAVAAVKHASTCVSQNSAMEEYECDCDRDVRIGRKFAAALPAFAEAWVSSRDRFLANAAALAAFEAER